jgi:hypothetical protein
MCIHLPTTSFLNANLLVIVICILKRISKRVNEMRVLGCASKTSASKKKIKCKQKNSSDRSISFGFHSRVCVCVRLVLSNRRKKSK